MYGTEEANVTDTESDKDQNGKINYLYGAIDWRVARNGNAREVVPVMIPGDTTNKL